MENNVSNHKAIFDFACYRTTLRRYQGVYQRAVAKARNGLNSIIQRSKQKQTWSMILISGPIRNLMGFDLDYYGPCLALLLLGSHVNYMGLLLEDRLLVSFPSRWNSIFNQKRKLIMC